KNLNLSIETDRIEYIEQTLKQLATVNSSVKREYYLKNLSEQFDLSIATLADEVNKYRKQAIRIEDKSSKDRYTSTKQRRPYEKRLLPAYLNAERYLLSYMLQNTSVAYKVQETLGAKFNHVDHQVIATH